MCTCVWMGVPSVQSMGEMQLFQDTKDAVHIKRRKGVYECKREKEK